MNDSLNLEENYLLGDYHHNREPHNGIANSSFNEESSKLDALGKDFLQGKKNGLYSEPALADSNDSISLGEVNKYYNLGFSENSQELIGEFYQNLVTQDSLKSKSFEEILYSIIEDIQVYKKDIRRLEQSLKNEKEHNEDVLRQMIDEADHQLAESGERIRNEERESCEKTIAKMKEHFETETSVLQETLARMKKMEEKYLSDKNAESLIILDLNEEVKSLRQENHNLKSMLRESTTQISILRSDLAEMKQVKDDQDSELIRKNLIVESHREIKDLKDEIRALHDANKKLNDANDLLREEIECIKIRTKAAEKEKITSIDESIIEDTSCSSSTTSSPESSHQTSSKALMLNESGNCSTLKISSSVRSCNDSDEDIGVDSGYYATTNESPYFLVGQSYNPNLMMANALHRNAFTESINLSHMSEISLLNGVNEHEQYKENKPFDEGNHELARHMSLHRRPSFNKHLRIPNGQPKIAKFTPLSSPTIRDVYRQDKNAPERMFKIVFAGDAAVGKTSFIMRYCKGQFLTTLSSTLGVDFHMKMLDIDGKSVALQLWDTCGQERFRSIAKSYFRRADGIVLMYDCNYERSFLNMREWIQIINDNNDKRIPIILVGNKTDLREASRATSTRPAVEYEDGLKLAKEFNTLFVETSAKEGTNMEESLIELTRQMSCTQDIELKSDSIRLGINEKKKKICC